MPLRKKINRRFIYLVVAIVLLLLLFVFFRGFLSNKSDDINKVPEPTDAFVIPSDTPTIEPTEETTPTEEVTKTPTPKPTSNPVDSKTGLDRSDLSVTVQNGSGEAGVAGTASDFLKGLGYDVIGAENADNFDYTNVTIKVKSTLGKYLTLLKNDLEDEYTVSSATSDLDDSFSSDALVIIGK